MLLIINGKTEMTLILIRILFFCLIPIGISIFIRGIQLIRKSFNGKILLEIPYLHKSGRFTVTKAGYFSVWQKGQLLKRTPVHKFRPHINDESTKEGLKLSFSFLGLQTNNFSIGRMELYRFYAPIGNYKIELKEGTNISKFENLAGKLIPLPSVDLSLYFIEIRESQSQIITFLTIPMILLGAFGAVGGLVLGLLADQI